MDCVKNGCVQQTRQGHGGTEGTNNTSPAGSAINSFNLGHEGKCGSNRFHHKVRHCCFNRPLYRLTPRSYYFDVYQTIPQLSNLRFLQPDLCLPIHSRCRGLTLHLITLSDILGRNTLGEESARDRPLPAKHKTFTRDKPYPQRDSNP